MNNNSIEDVIIDKNNNGKNKKGASVIFILFIIIILLGITAIVGYSHFTNKNKVSNKEMFFKAFSNINIEFFLKDETHSKLLEKFQNSSFEMNNDITMKNTMKEQTEIKDYSNYLLNWNMKNDIENNESFNQFGVSYSDNNLINYKFIKNNEISAVFSDKIVNKYICTNKKNFITLLDLFNIEINVFDIENEKFGKIQDYNKQLSKEPININEETKKQKTSEVFSILNNKLAEEKFSKEENKISLIKNDSSEVPVTAYTLNISSNEVISIAKEILTNLKNDKSFLEKFLISSNENTLQEKEEINVTNEYQDSLLSNEISNEIISEEISNEIENTITNEINNEITLDSQPSNIITIQTFNPVGTNLLTENSEENNNENTNEIISEDENESNENTSLIINEFNTLNEESADKIISPIKEALNTTEKIENIMINLLLGRKVNTSVEEIEQSIDFIIDYMQSKMSLNNLLSGNKEFKITVYVSETQTEKINILFPNNATLDIELNSKSENDRDVIITFLYEKENIKKFDNLNIQLNQNTVVEENVNQIQKNGFKLEANKQKNNSNTKIKLIYNVIEDEKINEKTLVELITKGNASSKSFENECDFIYSNNDGEIKVNIKNKTDFDKEIEIEKLTEENCVFLDNLSEEEKNLIITEIKNKIQEVSENQEKNLDFIDTNTEAPGITQNTTANKNELKNLIITEIGKLMGEALVSGETFSLESIQNLQLQDHNINIVIENGMAIIDIDGFKFSIDANFSLEEVE